MSQLWLHSDWHWRHDNIYSFTLKLPDGTERRIRERFANAAEGDAYMEQRWRDLVKPQDHVYCLGDLCMFRENHRADEFVKFFKSLPGHKRLILGNHDRLKTQWYIDAGFQKIRGSRFHDGLLLTHIPVHLSSISRRMKGNVHGHTHEKPDCSHLHLNVSVERTNYEPVPIEWVQGALAKKLEAHLLVQTRAEHGVFQ